MECEPIFVHSNQCFFSSFFYLELVVQKLVGYSYLVSSEQTIQEQ